MDHHHEGHGRAIKDIYVFALCRDVRRRLCQDPPPIFLEPSEPD